MPGEDHKSKKYSMQEVLNSVFDEASGTLKISSSTVSKTDSNGGSLELKVISEEVTIPVGSGFDPNVETTGDLAPAGSMILGCAYRVTQAPGGGATVLGITTTGGGDELVDVNTAPCASLGDTGDWFSYPAATPLTPIINKTASTLTIATDADVLTTDMKVRVTVWYFDITPPTS